MTFKAINTRFFMYAKEIQVQFEDGTTKWMTADAYLNLKAKQ